MEKTDKKPQEKKEMMIVGYGKDGERAMIVTDSPKTAAWFAARFERTEYKHLHFTKEK
ncbi:MAG: hypothetical protein L3J47_12085 [Sulfurovum sp.]|nr:hypothetical protein [Sulfurovum sp.]